MKLTDTTLDVALVEDLIETYDIETIEDLYRFMYHDPGLVSRYLLKFNIDYEELLEQVESYV